jgi:phosphonate transport system substrate-binding protein
MNHDKKKFHLKYKPIHLVFWAILLFSPPAYAKEPAKVIYFSAITLYHPIVMYQKYQPLMNYLSENTPYRFELKLSQNYRDIINFLKNDVVQIALLGGVTYVEAKKEFNVVPILKPLGFDGEPYYRCVFIARHTNAAVEKLADLKGKKVAFASKLSTSGYLAPLYHLYTKAGMRVEDFSHLVNLRYHDSVARGVLRGDFDAGAVIDSVANRFKVRGIKVIAVSGPIPGLPIAVRADTPAQLVAAIKRALLSLKYNDPADRKLMENWDEEFKYGFTTAKDADYDTIRTMIDFLSQKGIKVP